jgi:hypothetical protein
MLWCKGAREQNHNLIMVNWIIRKKFHIVFWAVLVVYLLSANSLYTHFFLKDGTPYRPSAALPAESTDVILKLGTLTAIRVDGQDLYELRGFAFNQSDPKMKNDISIVFRSTTQTLVIATHEITVPGMIRSFQGYQTGMDPAEFSLFLSQAVFKPDTYHIGVLLEDTAGPGRTFGMTGSVLKITPNTVQFTP